MARPRREDMELISQAQMFLKEAKTIEDLRSAQAVLLPALFNATLEQSAIAIGVARVSVVRLQKRFHRMIAMPGSTPASRGGRRRASMTVEDEKRFLEPWIEQARSGGMLVVAPLRAALSQELGRPISASVAYRLLARHGWRKVAPDTKHPKSDPAAQQLWKKNSAARWQPYADARSYAVGRSA